MPTGHYQRTTPHPMRGKEYRPLMDRFNSKVQRGAPDECWRWTGTILKMGYGNFRSGPGTTEYAHRFAWRAHNNAEIPAGLVVRHSCDNRWCVNPAHLSIGTHADNVMDKVRKGRQGAKCKLTPDQVREIRRESAAGARQVDLAAKYGVTVGAIRGIRIGKNWRRVA